MLDGGQEAATWEHWFLIKLRPAASSGRSRSFSHRCVTRTARVVHTSAAVLAVTRRRERVARVAYARGRREVLGDR